jgi:phosphoglycerate dehydrogenase-like enzyme
MDTIVFLCNPAMKALRLLDSLPDDVRIAVGLEPAAYANLIGEANILVINTDDQQLISEAFLAAPRLQWVHSLMAGLEKKLVPEIRASDIPMTNARGVFKNSLGEFVLTCCLYFAKDIRRMINQQRAGKWIPYDVEEIAGQTMSIIGYGEIGKAAAKRAHAMGMRVIGVRRRPELSADDPYAERIVGIADMKAVIAESDYVVVAAPNTHDTRHLIGREELSAMKQSAVFINVGRGTVVDEPALIEFLREGRIRGAGLDVFEVEPLPEGHPFYSLENVLLSPHCADNTATWLDESMQFFLDNYGRFKRGETLENIVDKQLGY